MENFCLVGFTRNYYVRYLIGTLIKWKFTSKLFPLSSLGVRWRFSLVESKFCRFFIYGFQMFSYPCDKKERFGANIFSFLLSLIVMEISFVRDKCFLLLFRYNFSRCANIRRANKFLYLFYFLEVERRRLENEIIHRQTVRDGMKFMLIDKRHLESILLLILITHQLLPFFEKVEW